MGILGMCGWGFILFEIFAGESSKASGNCSGSVKKAFGNMRLIVSLGWCIYPLGYFLGFLTGIADQTTLNVVYNIAALSTRSASCLPAGLAPRKTVRRRLRAGWEPSWLDHYRHIWKHASNLDLMHAFSLASRPCG